MFLCFFKNRGVLFALPGLGLGCAGCGVCGAASCPHPAWLCGWRLPVVISDLPGAVKGTINTF